METSPRAKAAGPRPRFPWGRSREVESWQACRSRCGLCRAGAGRREGRRRAAGPWDVAGRGRTAHKPRAAGPHLQEATCDSPTPGHSHWPLQPKFLLPGCAQPLLHHLSPGLAEGTRVACWDTGDTGAGDRPSVVALALQPVSRRSTRPAPPGPWTVLPVPFLRPKLAPSTACEVP